MFDDTSILMLRDGRIIFSGPNEELIKSEDPYIQEFIRGTEMDPGQEAEMRWKEQGE